MDVVYALEPGLSVSDFAAVLRASGLAERRPVDDVGRLARMVESADVIVTARIDGALVGVSRAITDFAYCTYLSDLAVDRAVQKRGIGRRLVEETHRAAGTETLLVLLAAPAARDYYPHIGMQRHDSCWIIPREH